ncbi:MAG TPA: hypothetical protein VNB06_11615, partial [Thermoanaerobaculia bacterium]|nr:hypothetical protein [Thermoanaerobaculia bacterium]
MLRVFLGDREPLLATAARWLVEEGSPPPPRARLALLDLEPLLIVVPGRRAGRRLLERLVVSAPGGAAALVPPTVVTPGVLPELIGPLPQLPLATELEALWVRIETLRQSSPALLETLLPVPPEHGDLLAWLDIARELEQLDDELAAECNDTEGVSRVLERDGAPEGELRRWRSLSDLRRSFEEQLSGRTRSARSRARLQVLAAAERRARQTSGTEEAQLRGSLRRVVLVGVADLPDLFRRLLLASGLDLVVLVPAPAERAGDFDDFGCPRPEVFLRRELRDTAASILVADRPLAQAAVAAECVARWTADGDQGCSPEDVTMAAASVESVALLADSLERAGLSYHVPTGRRLRDSQPAVLLRRLADYLDGGSSIEALGDLLRLPVVDEAFTILAEAALPALLAEAPSAGTPRRLRSAVAERRFLAAFDCFVETCLAPVVGDALPGDPVGAALVRAADRAVREIAGAVGGEPQRVPSGRRVAAILERAFGRHPLDLRVAGDAETAAALELLAERLHQLDALPELDPGAELSTILRFLLATLEDVRLEETAGHGGVEIVGWLELPLDDAPRLVVVDLVEGLLPASGIEDTFLPNSLRARLGLIDDRRRLSRDLHLLEVALASREQVVLATRRREADGQPSRPSRLLLRRHGAALGERIDLLLRSPPAAAPHDLWPRVATSGFQVPRPQPAEVLRALPVTAFDDYLACPYRFYLTRVLRLEVARERPHELDGAAFG